MFYASDLDVLAEALTCPAQLCLVQDLKAISKANGILLSKDDNDALPDICLRQ